MHAPNLFHIFINPLNHLDIRYVVTGAVAAIIYGEPRLTHDIDLVVEGNAIDLAQQLAQSSQRKITTHPRFGTAKLQWDKWSIDLATARSETYAKPGAGCASSRIYLPGKR